MKCKFSKRRTNSKLNMKIEDNTIYNNSQDLSILNPLSKIMGK